MLTRNLLCVLVAIQAAFAAPALEDSAELVERQFGGSCATGVHIIVARASTEPQGEGIIGQVATAVKSRIPGSDSEAIVYPATLYPYQSSEQAGVRAMTTAIQNYAQRCPNTKLVLMGYSQGAHVTGDTLCGGGSGYFGFGRLFKRQIASTYGNKVVAAIQMGDPSFIAGKSYDVGTGTRNGIFPRSSTSQACLQNYASKIQSYCDATDQFCQAGGTSSAVHLSYVRKYGTQAADFVVRKAQA